MKKAISILLALFLMAGTAFAAPVQLTNGEVTVTASALSDGAETELTLQSFQLLGKNDDGGYFIYCDGILYTVKAEAMEKAVVLPEEVPALGGMATLARGAKGEEVVWLQQGLQASGYLSGAADGDYGPGTERSVYAFQEAVGLEATGQADEITRLLVASMAAETLYLEGIVPPEVMYAPIMGRTSVDLQPIMDSGLRFAYDDIKGEGFISDGTAVEYDASGDTDLDKYELSLHFGLLTREDGDAVEIIPALKLRCLCVRRPMLSEVTIKAGTARGTAAVEDLRVDLDGVYTVEEGLVILTETMVDALAQAADAGELKLRIDGQYHSFDVDVSDYASVAAVGRLAQAIGE